MFYIHISSAPRMVAKFGCQTRVRQTITRTDFAYKFAGPHIFESSEFVYTLFNKMYLNSHSSLTVPIWAEIWSQGFMSQIFLALIFSQSTISQVQNPKILTRKFLLVQKLSHFEDGYLKNSEKSLKNDLWMV